MCFKTGIDLAVTRFLEILKNINSTEPDQEGNKLQRQKILIFIYPIYNHNWRNIGTIYIRIYIYVYIYIYIYI